MGRKSRRSKSISAREPNGRHSRIGEVREFAPATVRRLRDAALAQMENARWGTELGRLYLAQKIKPTALSSAEALLIAGERWAALAGRYQTAIAAPSPQSRSASLERGAAAQPPDPDSDAGAFMTAREAGDIKRFGEAHKILFDAGKLTEAVVRGVCEHNRVPGYFELEHLQHGLSMLAEHFGLTDLRRSVK